MNIETDPGSACNQTFHSFSRFTVSGFKFFRQIILLVLLNSCIQNMYKDVQFSGFAAKLLKFKTFFKSVLNNLSSSWQTAGFQHWVFTFSQYFTFPCCLFVTSLTNTQQHVWFSLQRAQLQVYSPIICVFFPLQPQKKINLKSPIGINVDLATCLSPHACWDQLHPPPVRGE